MLKNIYYVFFCVCVCVNGNLRGLLKTSVKSKDDGKHRHASEMCIIKNQYIYPHLKYIQFYVFLNYSLNYCLLTSPLLFIVT